jgi:hypothetical protein
MITASGRPAADQAKAAPARKSGSADALAGEVGVPAPDHHGEAGEKIRHRGEEADL